MKSLQPMKSPELALRPQPAWSPIWRSIALDASLIESTWAALRPRSVARQLRIDDVGYCVLEEYNAALIAWLQSTD